MAIVAYVFVAVAGRPSITWGLHVPCTLALTFFFYFYIHQVYKCFTICNYLMFCHTATTVAEVVQME